MRKRKTLWVRGCLLAVLACAACVPSWAQAQGNIRTVLFVKVKMGQEETWKSMVKEFAALDKKAGTDQGFTVWDSESGPDEHAVVWYSSTWKDLGEEDPKMKPFAAERASLFARLDTVTDSLETWIDEMQPDLMIRSENIPPMVRVARTKVLAGKMDEVRAIFRDQIVPAMKKAGVTDYGVGVARYGTPSNEFHTYMGMNGWGDLDGPVGTAKGMSPAEYKAFLAKISALIESTEWSLWKYQPDISYIPPAK